MADRLFRGSSQTALLNFAAVEVGKRDSCGIGDVEGRLRGPSRQGSKKIAALTHEPAHAAAFRTEHKGNPLTKFQLGQTLRCRLIETADPEAGNLQGINRAGEIDDP